MLVFSTQLFELLPLYLLYDSTLLPFPVSKLQYIPKSRGLRVSALIAGAYTATLYVMVHITGRQPPPLSSVLYMIISGRRSVLAAQLLLREKSGA